MNLRARAPRYNVNLVIHETSRDVLSVFSFSYSLVTAMAGAD